MVRLDARHPVEEVDLPELCARCSHHHPEGRACFPRVRWVAALGEDLAEAATSLRGLLDAIRGDRDPPGHWRRVVAGGGTGAVVLAALRAAGVL